MKTNLDKRSTIIYPIINLISVGANSRWTTGTNFIQFHHKPLIIFAGSWCSQPIALHFFSFRIKSWHEVSKIQTLFNLHFCKLMIFIVILYLRE